MTEETATETGAEDQQIDTGTETAETTQEVATDDLTEGDRAKLTEVVRKERAAAKSAKSAAEKAKARLAELESAELRRTVAEERGLTAEQAAFLSGTSAEEMGAAADALLAAFQPASGDTPRRPREALKSGTLGSSEPPDMAAVADRVLD